MRNTFTLESFYCSITPVAINLTHLLLWLPSWNILLSVGSQTGTQSVTVAPAAKTSLNAFESTLDVLGAVSIPVA